MINFWKIFVTLPFFIWTILKSKIMFKKIKKDPNLVSEEYRYFWLKKRCKYLIWLFDIKLIIHNKNNWIDKGCLLVSNHQSNIDPALIFSLNDFVKTAPCAFIAKKELENDKKIKNLISLIDVLFLDRNNPRQAIEIINSANELIRIPRSMVIFPEGTRSNNQYMNDFHYGSFKIAQKAHVPIIPISIINSYKIMNKSKKYKGKKYIHIIFHKPIKPDKFITKKTYLIADNIKKIINNGINKYKNVDNIKYYKKYKIDLKNNKNNKNNIF